MSSYYKDPIFKNMTFKLYEKVDNKYIDMLVHIHHIKALVTIARRYINEDAHDKIFVEVFVNGNEIDELMQPLSDYTHVCTLERNSDDFVQK